MSNSFANAVKRLATHLKTLLKKTTSRKFLFAVGVFAIVVINKVKGLSLTDNDLLFITSIAGGYIFTEGAIDYKRLIDTAIKVTDKTESIVTKIKE